MASVCFVDLDGVLCNFVGPALARHGKRLPMKEVRWGFPGQVGFKGVNDPAFWDPLGHDFWASLPWTVEGKVLLAGVERLFGGRVCVLTSPCSTPGGVEGKVAWIRREMPAYKGRFLVGPPKELIAGPGKLLVDDNTEHCQRWRRPGDDIPGGPSVLVPRPWNDRRAESGEDGSFDVHALLREIGKAREEG